MSDTPYTGPEAGGVSRDEMLSALFAQMVVQQANLAMMLLGKMPHPRSGQKVQDLEGARLFIDQLEMIEIKTKGNLSKEEESLLKQTLLSLHLAFVEVVESPAPSPPPGSTPAAPERTAEPAASLPESKPASEAAAAEAESRKKFSKKY